MTWGAVATVGGAVIGGIASSSAARSASRAASRDAKRAAQAEIQAGREGAIASAFRPVGMTTRFGTSQFTETIDPKTGLPRVTGAQYMLSPELQAIQDRVMGLTGGAVTSAEEAQARSAALGLGSEGMFNLAQQYMATSPEQARQQYMQEQYALLDPIRQREEQRLGAGVFGRGRAGLNVSGIGQPELYSLAQARREQDLQLAAGAEQAARDRINFGAGLFGTGADLLGRQYGIQTESLAPLQAYLGTVGSVEEMGQDPFRLGMELGGQVRQGGDTAGRLLSQSGQQAAATRLAGQNRARDINADFLSGLLQTTTNYLNRPSPSSPSRSPVSTYIGASPSWYSGADAW